MPELKEIVINTSPLIAIVAALSDLEILRSLYKNVFVTHEVSQEILTGGCEGFAVEAFEKAAWLNKLSNPLEISPYLKNSLDHGEASVIQLALNKKIQTVCIDETMGRRIAKLSGLTVTGSIGVLLRAKKEGLVERESCPLCVATGRRKPEGMIEQMGYSRRKPEMEELTLQLQSMR